MRGLGFLLVLVVGAKVDDDAGLLQFQRQRAGISNDHVRPHGGTSDAGGSREDGEDLKDAIENLACKVEGTCSELCEGYRKVALLKLEIPETCQRKPCPEMWAFESAFKKFFPHVTEYCNFNPAIAAVQDCQTVLFYARMMNESKDSTTGDVVGDERDVAEAIREGGMEDLKRFISPEVITALSELMQKCSAGGDGCQALQMMRHVKEAIQSCQDGLQDTALCRSVSGFQNLIGHVAKIIDTCPSGDECMKLMRLARVKDMKPCCGGDGKCAAMMRFKRIVAFVSQMVSGFAQSCSDADDGDEMCEKLLMFEKLLGGPNKAELQDNKGRGRNVMVEINNLLGEDLLLAIEEMMATCALVDCDTLSLVDFDGKIKTCKTNGIEDGNCRMVLAFDTLATESGTFMQNQTQVEKLKRLASCPHCPGAEGLNETLGIFLAFWEGVGRSCDQNPSKHCQTVKQMIQLHSQVDQAEGCQQEKQHNCFTREMWSPEKKQWCCRHQEIGCMENENICDNKKLKGAKRAWCLKKTKEAKKTQSEMQRLNKATQKCKRKAAKAAAKKAKAEEQAAAKKARAEERKLKREKMLEAKKNKDERR